MLDPAVPSPSEPVVESVSLIDTSSTPPVSPHRSLRSTLLSSEQRVSWVALQPQMMAYPVGHPVLQGWHTPVESSKKAVPGTQPAMTVVGATVGTPVGGPQLAFASQIPDRHCEGSSQ